LSETDQTDSQYSVEGSGDALAGKQRADFRAGGLGAAKFRIGGVAL